MTRSSRRVDPPQVPVDRQVRLQQPVLGRQVGLHICRSVQDGRDDPAEKIVAHRQAAASKRFRKRSVTELGQPQIARLVDAKEIDRRLEILVMGQSEERDSCGRVRPYQTCARCRVAAIRPVPDTDTAVGRPAASHDIPPSRRRRD